MSEPTIAVLIPCYNEAITIEKVIRDFQTALPDAAIYVYDNNSTDQTAERAARAGAIVRKESRQGKGFVVQAMFREIDAEYYVLVDGDDTYSAANVKALLEPVMSGEYDMSVGTRLVQKEAESFRRFHILGNQMIRDMINWLFKVQLRDILSGYRCFSKRFVQTCPLMSQGFEIETELTLQALNKRFKIFEQDLPYGSRPEGSVSKLNTFRDGFVVVNAIFKIFRDYKPLGFFFSIGSVALLAGMAAGWIVVMEFLDTRYITHVPLAIFSVGSVLVAFLCYGVGLILDTINRRFNEIFDVQIKTR